MAEFNIRARLEKDYGADLDMLNAGVVASIQQAVSDIAQAARGEWIRLAQNKLRSSRGDYINGLNQATSFQQRGNSFEITLVGRMANNHEFGMPSFDMKGVRPGWLGGGKAKTTKDGKKYVVIPFRHSESSETNMRYTGQAAAVSTPDLKTRLRTAVKDYGLDRMLRTATGQVIPGPVVRVPNNAPVHPYLKGLTRVQTPTRGTTAGGQQKGSSQLLTWRVMSENSRPGSWIHPGIKPANILPDVEKWVDEQLDRMLETMLS